MADRPQYYPLHDVQLNNLTPVQQSPYLFSGYPTLLPVPSSDHNGKFNSLGGWVAYTDQCRLCNTDWLASQLADKFALSQSFLSYADGGNITTTGGVVATRGVYLFNGVRLETDDALLNPIGQSFSGSPLKFVSPTRPGRIWVYVAKSGQLRIESVGPLVNDSPTADEMTLAGHEVDGVGVLINGPIAPITDPLPAYELGIVIPLVVGTDTDLQALSVASQSTLQTAFIENTGTGAALVIEGDGTATDKPALAVTNTDVGIGAIITSDGGALPTLAVVHSSSGFALAVNGSATIGQTPANVHTFNGTVTCADNAVLGTDNGDTCLVKALATFSETADFDEGLTVATGKDVTLENAAGITGTANSLVAVGQVNTIDANGRVTTAGTKLLTVVGATTNNAGTLQWDGRSFTCGDGTIAAGRRVAMPHDSYIAGPINTGNSINDTGASIALFMKIGEVAIVEMKSEIKNDSLVAPSNNFRIEANAVIIGGSEPRRAVVNNVPVDCNRSVSYVAVAEANVVFKARYGTNNGTSTATNILLTVRRAQ